ncbi:Hypothetical protein NTJ_01274 [Nesidiocoris tenuis]|uniref:Secreted protein n=1 Tax=Nesidiocoris tenuis TaxID=355587 RepID=A0ABN7A859_9HEMI|nr:Hypothetical protein NTJ_01274 [Nesidiocoris tenuis]
MKIVFSCLTFAQLRLLLGSLATKYFQEGDGTVFHLLPYSTPHTTQRPHPLHGSVFGRPLSVGSPLCHYG